MSVTICNMLDKILTFIREAGDYARANQINVGFSGSSIYKSDHISDVVTETDLEVSRRFKQFVKSEFADLDYAIMDEESISDLGDDPLTEAKRHEYIFVLDPIDGTLPYAAGLPFFGISIGVFRNQKPVAGAIYLPRLNLLVSADDQQGTIDEDGNQRPLMRLTEAAPIFSNGAIFPINYTQCDQMNVYPLSPYAASVSGAYTAMGKFRSWAISPPLRFWDMAGAYCLFAISGVKIYDIATDGSIDMFDDGLFNNELSVIKPKIICLPEYYADFKKMYEIADCY